ncbi:MAG: histone deacetylase family protein [Nitriliruptoraceae bacterium]
MGAAGHVTATSTAAPRWDETDRLRGFPVVTDDTHRAHDPPFELNAGERVSPVPERPARVESIVTALRAAGATEHPAVAHDDGILDGVHDAELIAFLRDGHAAWRAAGGPEVLLPDTFRSPVWAAGGRRPTTPRGLAGYYATDTATPLVAGSYTAARAAVDVACTAVDHVLAGARAVYGLTRPPGHHAGPAYFGGFCLLNHAAVAARALQGAGRVAIIDVDVHHGNGTQDVFWDDPDVLYVSVHADPHHHYPFFSGYPEELGGGAGRGTTRNLPLAPGTGEDDYLRAVEIACELTTTFAPASVVISLGFDAAEVDPVGGLSVRTDAFDRLGRLLAALDLPTVLLQEGGYALDELGELAVRTLGAWSR